MNCPACGAPMPEQSLEGHLGATVAINVCLPCQALWFDAHESLQLSPGAVLALFRLIGEQARAKPVPPPSGMACPRCGAGLVLSHDLQRNTHFEYWRCPREHGRLTTFFNFLREKDFIRPLSAEQIADLRRNLSAVTCSSCGAPIDLSKDSACAHCGSPLSMLDVKQAGALVAGVGPAPEPRRAVAVPPSPQHARFDPESAFASFHRDPAWFEDASSLGLVGAGLGAIARWLSGER